MDLGVWWRARRWRALLHLIELLPSDSRTSEARLRNPEEAVAMIEAREQRRRAGHDEEEWAPPLHQYDLHAQLLHELVNLARGLVGAPALPMPRTAVATELQRRTELSALDLVARLTPRYAHLLEEALAKGEQ